MPIIRGEHSFDAHFTQIPNAWLRDNRLTYKARGLLSELISHSVGWEVSIARIAALGIDGRDSIGSAIQELEQLGYLRREQQRDPSGRLSGNLWITQDPDQPLTEKPLTAKPLPDNPHPKKNIDKNTYLKEVNAQFDTFWNTYPRRVGRGNALKSFVALSSEERELSIAGSQRMALDRNLPSLQFVPYPATWINREGWLDDSYPERERTPEEKEAWVKAEAVKKAERIAQDRQLLLREQAEQKNKAELDPPKRCQHNTVAVICKVCAKLEKNKGVSNGRD